MAFAITKSCCADASCVSVCPVGCIHPAPGEAGFGTSEILHIDPEACIDCGACADACPVQAIFPVDKLSPADQVYAQINADYARGPADSAASTSAQIYPHLPQIPANLRVAVVGSGPAGMYTVKELLTRTDADITVIDALPTPGGLLRSGVASDHPETKGIQRVFDIALRHPRVHFLGGVHVGTQVSLADIRASYDAVFLATGARVPRRLGVPGENRDDVVSALDVVRWAGGEPGADSSPIPAQPAGAAGEDAYNKRAVIVGTGNVALDLVRLFTLPPARLATTDVADRALTVLRDQPIRDVAVLGRGTSTSAAYTEAEYRALAHLPELEIRVVDAADSVAQLDWSRPHTPRVTFVFGSSVERFSEPDDGGPLTVEICRPSADESFSWAARLAITSIGHDAEPIDGLPPRADDSLPSSPNPPDAGRVAALPGVYLVGWAKRGPVGGIGANRLCAAESVNSFLEDANELPRATRSVAAFEADLRRGGVRTVDRRGSTRINDAETRAGRSEGRPRIKLTDLDALHQAARRRIGAR